MSSDRPTLCRVTFRLTTRTSVVSSDHSDKCSVESDRMSSPTECRVGPNVESYRMSSPTECRVGPNVESYRVLSRIECRVRPSVDSDRGRPECPECIDSICVFVKVFVGLYVIGMAPERPDRREGRCPFEPRPLTG